MDSETKQPAAGQGAGVARTSIKHVRRLRKMTVLTSDGPIVVDLSECFGKVRYVPVVVPAGVVVRVEDIEVEK